MGESSARDTQVTGERGMHAQRGVVPEAGHPPGSWKSRSDLRRKVRPDHHVEDKHPEVIVEILRLQGIIRKGCQWRRVRSTDLQEAPAFEQVCVKGEEPGEPWSPGQRPEKEQQEVNQQPRVPLGKWGE